MDGAAEHAGGPAVELTLVDPGVQVIRVTDRPDADTTSQLAEVLAHVLLQSPWAIVVDLSALDGLDLHAVQVLTGAARWAGELDIGYVLAGPSQAAMTTLAAAGCRRLFEIHGTPGEALAALRDGPIQSSA
ncbi:STAS domain-containing protein [Pseudonocardia acidicola]|uniref:STAS domain-containing protein n=1 Tax=Pseudonocardia acidicola TaxID=2724939 RepID=A0ABX1S8K4_9PSEU|nr:STAS domain-containing protein [Pseudonocardia acidicola]NMH97898.1 STAS domain-containing protein [Pseudonocardia acidicola]